MPLSPLPIYGGFYRSPSLPFSAQRLVNAHVVPAQGQSLADAMIVGDDGISQVATAGDFHYISRGSHVFNGVPFFVQGGSLVRLNQDETITVIGSISGSGRVSMANVADQLMILNSSGNGWVYDGATLTAITDPNFTANGLPQIVVEKDDYFICSTDTNRFIASDDGLTWFATYYANADVGLLQAPVSFKGQLFLLGQNSTSSFQNIGGSEFPFQKVTGWTCNRGLSFRHAVVTAADAFFFVGCGVNETPAIWASTGSPDVQKISTDAIDFAIRQELVKDGIKDSFAFQFSRDGSYFIGFSFPEKTFLYEIASKKWSERESNISGVVYRWRANSISQAYGKIYVGDMRDGRIGLLSADVYKEYDQLIHRTLVTQPFANGGDPIFIPLLELTMESGVGNEEAADPMISMRWSKDARNWSDYRERPIGKVGEYRRRTIWRRLGRFARFTLFQFSCSEPIKFVIIKLEADIRGGHA